MSSTLLLDVSKWDLVLDISGSIALAVVPYAPVQDVASAVRLFIGEAWYDTSLGIPYFEQILGQWPSLEYMREQFITAALTVPLVEEADCYFIDFTHRKLRGQIQPTISGVTQAVGF